MQVTISSEQFYLNLDLLGNYLFKERFIKSIHNQASEVRKNYGSISPTFL